MHFVYEPNLLDFPLIALVGNDMYVLWAFTERYVWYNNVKFIIWDKLFLLQCGKVSKYDKFSQGKSEKKRPSTKVLVKVAQYFITDDRMAHFCKLQSILDIS